MPSYVRKTPKPKTSKPPTVRSFYDELQALKKRVHSLEARADRQARDNVREDD